MTQEPAAFNTVVLNMLGSTKGIVEPESESNCDGRVGYTDKIREERRESLKLKLTT